MAPTSKGSSTRSALIAVSDYKREVTREQVSFHGRKRFANDFTSKVNRRRNLKLARNIVASLEAVRRVFALFALRQAI